MNILVTTYYQTYDETKFHMVKGINNAFDHMELLYLSGYKTGFSLL